MEGAYGASPETDCNVSENRLRHCPESCSCRTAPTARTAGNSRSAAHRRKLMAPFRGRIFKLSLFVMLSVFITCIYLTYFRHPPPDVLLKMNRKLPGNTNVKFDSGKKNGIQLDNILDELDIKPEDELDITPEDEDEESDKDISAKQSNSENEVSGTEYWNNFIARNNFVNIGAVYDRCDGPRTQIGTVILEEDKDLGGVRSRTFLNITLEEQVSGGEFHIEVKYNSKHLFDNYWELCEVEAEIPDQNKTFICPVSPGKYSKQRTRHVPGYLPSGRYQTKAWATDEQKKLLACGFSDFQI